MIVYLHGFNSSPASHKAQVLQRHLEGRGLANRFSCPALPDTPAEAIQVIKQAIAGQSPGGVTFVGSSLGGYYATWLAEKLGCRAVLVNPAIYAAHRAGGLSRHAEEPAYRRALRADARAPGRLAPAAGRCASIRNATCCSLETGDEVLDWREAARKYEGARMVIRQGGDHSLQCFAEMIPRILAFSA